MPEYGHRTVTLVFAKERSKEAIKEALENQRTAVWFKNTLIGRPEFLVPLIQNSLMAERDEEARGVTVHIENNSDAHFILDNISEYSFRNFPGIITVNPHGSTMVRIKGADDMEAPELKFRVLNALTAPGKHPEIIVKID